HRRFGGGESDGTDMPALSVSARRGLASGGTRLPSPTSFGSQPQSSVEHVPVTGDTDHHDRFRAPACPRHVHVGTGFVGTVDSGVPASSGSGGTVALDLDGPGRTGRTGRQGTDLRRVRRRPGGL